MLDSSPSRRRPFPSLDPFAEEGLTLVCAQDVVVPSDYSERLIRGLLRGGANGSEARLTLYDAAPAPKGWPDYEGHGSPMPAYATAELYEWLLARHL